MTMAVCAVSYKPTGKPRGIMRPRRVSPTMQELVGVPEISRTEALKLIWAHIKQNNLQDPDDKRIIVCDEKLKNIFAGKDPTLQFGDRVLSKKLVLGSSYMISPIKFLPGDVNVMTLRNTIALVAVIIIKVSGVFKRCRYAERMRRMAVAKPPTAA